MTTEVSAVSDPEVGPKEAFTDIDIISGKQVNKRSFPKISTILMWALLFITLSVATLLLVDIFSRTPQDLNKPHDTAINASSQGSVTSQLDGKQDIMVAGQTFAVVDKIMTPATFDKSPFQTVSIRGRIKRYAASLADKFRAIMDRREIQMSAQVSFVISVISVLIIIGCTALAVQAGVMNSPMLDVGMLHMAKRIFFYASFILSTVSVMAMVFALYLIPGNRVLQILASVVALLAVTAITGAMISELIYRAQATVLSDVMNTDVSKFGLWLTQFGLGGVMSFGMGVFGTFLAMFGVEMILFRVKGTWQEPVLMSIALPTSILYNFGCKHLSFFQILLKFALLIRLVLWGLAFAMPHLATI